VSGEVLGDGSLEFQPVASSASYAEHPASWLCFLLLASRGCASGRLWHEGFARISRVVGANKLASEGLDIV
jgi:hypothetical protein